MKLKEIHRTATFAWSPTPSVPLLATGTVAGALDESFSNESQLEIWAPDFLDKNEYEMGREMQPGASATVTTATRFNRLAWGAVSPSRPEGVIVAGMENGSLDIWDPVKILGNEDDTTALILQNTTHSGPVRGLDFNPLQTTLFASGGVNGEIFIWDLKDPSKPYSPGARSQKLDEITALAWNHQVPHILSTSSSTGYTVVWDLRGKREVVALAYGGGAGTLAGGPAGIGIGGRRGMSDVVWHPDNATRLVTASEDDASPIIMLWDLRNARAPEKILTGHEKGILSLSWCTQDSDLLLSCGKDNRALCWNPQTSEIVGELPAADNWAFQIDWCPRNPDLLATANFDGTIGLHSIQSTNEGSSTLPMQTPKANGADVFDVPGYGRTTEATFTLSQTPKWLRRPASSSFGYGGKLVSVSNLPSAQGKNQSSVVHIRSVATEPSVVDRVTKLKAAIDGETLEAFAEEQTSTSEGKADLPSWKALISLFKADSRDELVTLLGFSKSEIASRVAEAVENLQLSAKTAAQLKSDSEEDLGKPHEPIVSFAEPEVEPEPEPEEGAAGKETAGDEAAPSEVSTSVASDGTQLPDGESTTTAPSLFDDDNAIGTPQGDAAADFFSSMGTIGENPSEQVHVPHYNYPVDSSVAATIGSRPSSAASLKNNTFRIYPTNESDTDRLVTKALVLGDFESAVALCLSSDRFADAILLAAKGGPELLQRTQKKYFEKKTSALPYLRLFQSIVTNDLADIVQNADLQEWQEIFVVLCTYAKPDEFPVLVEQLGQRLEFQGSLVARLDSEDSAAGHQEFRKNATLTYLAAGRLEKVVNVWIEEMVEEEARLSESEEHTSDSQYSAHAHALQTLIEKVTVFRSAMKYVDSDLSQAPSTDDAKVYKLSALYDRYFEYADLLATQGLIKEAVTFVNLTPGDYSGAPGAIFESARERLLAASGPVASSSRLPAAPAAASTYSKPAAQALPASTSQGSYGYPSYGAGAANPGTFVPSAPQHAPAASQRALQYESFNPNSLSTQPQPAPTMSSYAPAAPTHNAIPPSQSMYGNSYGQQQGGYGQSGGYGQQGGFSQPGFGQPAAPPPPPPASGPPKRTDDGWNDPPASVGRRTPAPARQQPGKVEPITSPFPNAPSTPMSPAFMHGQPPTPLPPPPRPGSVNRNLGPPGAGQRMPPQSQGPPGPGQYGHPPGPGQFGGPARPPSEMGMNGPPRPGMGGPPPLGAGGPPPPNRGVQISPPGPPRGPPGPPGAGYGRGTPPPGPGPYGPPPGAGQPGAYHGGPPPPQQAPGPYGPPPGARQGGPGSGPPGPQGPPMSNAPPPLLQNMQPQPPRAPPAPKGPPPPKYPPGDRTHIPDSARPAFDVISAQLEHMKQTTPPQQKRMVDDCERRLNQLFDALNCETLSAPVVQQLLVLTDAMAAHDRDRAMGIHTDLLTNGSRTDEIALWMVALKQLILRL